MLAIALDRLNPFRSFFRGVFIVAYEFSKAQNCTQGSSDLMAHVSEKITLGFIGLLSCLTHHDQFVFGLFFIIYISKSTQPRYHLPICIGFWQCSTKMPIVLTILSSL